MSGRFGTFAVIAGLMLGGCGGSVARDPAASRPVAPTTGPTVSVTLTASPSPSQVAPTVPADVPTSGPNLKVEGERPPVMPVAATQHTRAGAVAFAEFFIRTIDWGFATTSGSYMRHYYAPTCVECASHADSLDATARAGHHYLGGRFHIQLAAPTDQVGMAITVTFDVSSVEVVDHTGQFVNGGPAQENVREQLALAWRQGQWIIEVMAPS